MRTSFYSVFDSKSGVFCSPFISPNDDVAIRDFRHASTDPQTSICKFPSDFTLYRLASFDDSTGVIVAESSPVAIVAAISLVPFKE